MTYQNGSVLLAEPAALRGGPGDVQTRFDDRFHRDTGLPVVVLNPSLLLGPGDARLSSTDVVFKFLERRIPALPSGGLSFVDVAARASATSSAEPT